MKHILDGIVVIDFTQVVADAARQQNIDQQLIKPLFF